jgi:hypothetical protein
MRYVIDILGISASLLLIANAMLYSASVLIHHTSHRQGAQPRKFGELLAELAGILLLRQTLITYQKAHGLHHGKTTFADINHDPDAQLVWKLGFRPGDSVAESNRKLRRCLLSPSVHGILLWERLSLNFARPQEPRRTVAACLIWTAIGFWVWQHQLLLAFSQFLALALIAGNLASLLELLSRHKWLINPPATADRHWTLSHARFFAVIPPEPGASLGCRLQWWLKILQGIIEHLCITAGDLAWHVGHHVHWDANDYQGQPAWSNPQYAYAPYLTQLTEDKYYLSANAAIQAWFAELAAAPQQQNN